MTDRLWRERRSHMLLMPRLRIPLPLLAVLSRRLGLVPNDAGGGWTQPKILGEVLRQTYIGLVCWQDDTLHTVFHL